MIKLDERVAHASLIENMSLSLVATQPQLMEAYELLNCPVAVVPSIEQANLALNSAAKKLLGIPQLHSEISLRLFDYIRPAHHSALKNYLKHFRRGEQSETLPVYLRTVDQGWHRYQLSARLIASNGSKEVSCLIISLVKANVDVPNSVNYSSETSRERELKRASLDSLLWNAKDIGYIYVHQLDHETATWSPGMQRMLGYQPGEMSITTNTYLSLIPSPEKEKIQQQLADLIAGRIHAINIDHQLKCKDASHIWVNARAKVDVTGSGEKSIVSIITNINQRELAVLDAHIFQEELETFTYSISHDLRAPVRHIESFVALLLESAGDKLDESEKQFADYAQKSVRRLGEMIQGLVSYSRLPHAVGVAVWVDLNLIVSGQIDRLEHKNVQLKIGKLPEVYGYPSLLAIAIYELLLNATKFSADQDEALISVRWEDHPEHGMGLVIRDNGIGFDGRHTDKLFKIFQRLHGPLEFPGIGIGLATVKRIVGLHKGEVWAEGSPNMGAAFGLILPEVRPSRSTFHQ